MPLRTPSPPSANCPGPGSLFCTRGHHGFTVFDIYSNMMTLFALNLPGSGHVDLPLVITHQPVAPRNTASFIDHRERGWVRQICGIFSVRSTALICTAEEGPTARVRGQRLNMCPGHRTAQHSATTAFIRTGWTPRGQCVRRHVGSLRSVTLLRG